MDKKLPVCLDIASGEFPKKLEGYQMITVDARREPNPNINCDVRKLPYPDESIDAIYAGHILEHFSFRETDAILEEWLRVVKKNGCIYIKVPNTKYLCEQILNDNDKCDSLFGVPAIVALFGSHENNYQIHYNAFTVKSLFELMIRHHCDGECMVVSDNHEILFDGIKL